MAKYNQEKKKLRKVWLKINNNEEKIEDLSRYNIYYTSLNYKNNINIYQTIPIYMNRNDTTYRDNNVQIQLTERLELRESESVTLDANLISYYLIKIFKIELKNLPIEILSQIKVIPIISTNAEYQDYEDNSTINLNFLNGFFFNYGIKSLLNENTEEGETGNYYLEAMVGFIQKYIDPIAYEYPLYISLVINIQDNRKYYEIRTDKK